VWLDAGFSSAVGCGFCVTHSLLTRPAANSPVNAAEIGKTMDQDAQLSGETAAIVDPGLLRAFLDNHRDLVRFLSRRLRCLFTARDLAQEVYLRLGRAGGDEVVENPRALLFRIAANLATDHVRVQGRRAELLQEANGLLWDQEDEISPERQILAKDELVRIGAALSCLPERTKRVFYLNRFEGVTQSEIALQLGISRTSVEKHMRRAWACVADARGANDPAEISDAGGGKPSRSLVIAVDIPT
jgi:RNA polymerase sigma factor (sigma-70 family)